MTTIPTPPIAAATAIARDARRVRVLTGVTVLLWSAAAAAVTSLLCVYYLSVVPRLHAMTELGDQVARQEAQGEAPIPEDVQKLGRWTTSLGTAVTMGAAILAASVGILALASLGTVLLVFASRRATLRQIQASLADISAQLAVLRSQPPPTDLPPR